MSFLCHRKEIGLEQLKFSLDEQAVKMSELKEDYIKRRKGLAASIKSFSVTYLQPSEGDDDNEANDWKAPTSELLEMFKGEYDALSIFTKFAETAFLSVFKSFREAEDPVNIYFSNNTFAFTNYKYLRRYLLKCNSTGGSSFRCQCISSKPKGNA